MSTISQMRGQARPGLDRISNAFSTGRRVSQGDNDSRAAQALDKGQRPGCLWCKRHEADATACQVLQSAELVPIRRADVLARVRPTRSILGGDVRAFQMDTGYSARKLGVLLASLA